MSEETVRVDIGDDYYKGAYFNEGVDGDYEVSVSQMERWKEVSAAYEAMQDEIEQVMEQQRDRVLALMLERRKGQPSTVPPAIQAAYEDAIARMLQQPPLLKREEGS
ncbi:hypothetical protein AS594_07190 [Streptomyces agglomeratus]|uniref:Uncharacterized protein n=1 Tax=Streptomyces agglomeratus TaxID=285458 RepID=A0A1E5P4A4_9ACTN|nr:hypothetical protein [Streptomyces agglomeratus]OEJ24307.1 hypothetical protein AS594_07190 [Streptomyces agglomeratus]